MPINTLVQALLQRNRLPTLPDNPLTSTPTAGAGWEPIWAEVQKTRPDLAKRVKRIDTEGLGGTGGSISLALDSAPDTMHLGAVDGVLSPTDRLRKILIHELTHATDMQDPIDRAAAIRQNHQISDVAMRPFELRAQDAADEYIRRRK